MRALIGYLVVVSLLGAIACGGGSGSSAEVAIHIPVSLTTVGTEDGFQFEATDGRGHTVAAIWSVLEGAGGGLVDSQGYYTAPATPGTFHVVASRDGHQATSTVQVIPLTPELFLYPSGSIHLATGASQLFRATFNNLGNHAVAWSLAGAGTLEADGFFAASTTPGTSTITCTSLKNPLLRKSLQVVVEPPSQPAFHYTGGWAKLSTGTTLSFDQSLGGITDNRIVWSLLGGGSVNPDGVVTLPNVTGIVQLQMQSAAAPSLITTMPIEVHASLDPIKVAIQISPTSVSLPPGASQAFTATVGGVPPLRQPVLWWILEGRGTGGILTSDGHYTAPTTPGTYHVVVTPLAEARIRAVATVVVAP